MCSFCIQNRDFWTRITNLYVSLTSPVVLCMQNRVISTSTLVSMGPIPHLWFLLANQRFWTKIACFYGSQTSSVVLSAHYSVPSTRIKRLYWFHTSPVVLCMQNSVPIIGITSVWVPALISGFCLQNSAFWSRITSLRMHQTSPVDL